MRFDLNKTKKMEQKMWGMGKGVIRVRKLDGCKSFTSVINYVLECLE